MNNQALQQIVKELDKRVEEFQREKNEAARLKMEAFEKARQLEYDTKEQVRQLRARGHALFFTATRRLEKILVAKNVLCAMLEEQEDQS